MGIPHSLTRSALDEGEGKCAYCGKKLAGNNAIYDHIVPRSAGGASVRENLRVACQECNLQKADQILGTVANPIARPAATAWVHAYIRFPKTTTVITFLVAVIVVLAGSYLYLGIAENKASTPSSDLDFTRQVRQLDDTEANLNALLAFVAVQRAQLSQTQESLKVLREEKTKIEPLLAADKKTVEAIFAAQEARAAQAVTRERWIGFILGVIASIVATVVVTITQYFVRLRKEALDKG